MLQARHRKPCAFAEYVPWKRVGTSTSSPSGRTRVSADCRAQNKPEPLVVVTYPASSGPPHVAHRCSTQIVPSGRLSPSILPLRPVARSERAFVITGSGCVLNLRRLRGQTRWDFDRAF